MKKANNPKEYFPKPDAIRCVVMTKYGFGRRCRHVAVKDGLCTKHLKLKRFGEDVLL